MKKYFLLLTVILFSALLPAREKRNFLTASYTKQQIREFLVKGDRWIEYPAYSDRNSWNKINTSLREKYIHNGEKYLGYDWPAIKATDYLEFSRSGDRRIMERPLDERRNALQSLVMAELMEGKGRFMDDIVNGVFLFCEQTYWGASAHFYMYKEDESPGDGNPTTNLPDIDNPIIDLLVGEVAADLSWIWYYFHEEFDKISPVVSRRLKSELKKKVLDPFYERDDYWWITGWKRGSVNNWTPWCNFNVLNCILLLEDDPDKKAEAVYKTMKSVDLFFNVYPEDGACDEGPSYWGVAGGKAFDYLNLLSAVTDGRVNIFDKRLVQDMGRYIYRVYISQGHFYTNFADAPPVINQRGGTIYRYGQQIKDEKMKSFGAFLLDKSGFEKEPVIKSIGLVLEDMFKITDLQDTKSLEPLIPEFYFPDMQIAIARNKAGSNDGFYLAAKGGSNGEGHNHNDVGSCIVFFSGEPALIDVGVGTYTKETFTANRYKIWTMQSTYHNVPLINGIPQRPGGEYRASNSMYKASKSKILFSTDIAGAYPEEAGVQKWVRSYTLERNKGIRIADHFQLRESVGDTELHFVTPLQCSIVKPGLMELKGKGFVLRMDYESDQYDADIRKIPVDDSVLQRAWGNELSMIVLKTGGEKSGNYSIRLREKK